MIQIIPNNIQKIEELHLNHCKPFILKCIKFYKDFFERLGNNKYVVFGSESVSKYYHLDPKQIPPMIQPFLKNKYKKKGKQEVRINDIKSLLSTKNSNIIKDINNLDYYRKLLALIVSIESDIDKILVGLPTDLNRLKNKSTYKNNAIKKHIFENILRYDMLTNDGFEISINGAPSTWGSYTLTSALGVNVCPYCNRNWINTVGEQNKKATSPQLDHFFSKKDFPVLRLSLYNLIPSCETCNSRLKSFTEFIYGKNLHPYEEGYRSYAKFYTVGNDCESVLGRANNFTIGIKYSDLTTANTEEKIKRNHKLFKINEIYKYHGDIISEIYLKKQLYSITYLEMLLKNIKFQHNITKKDLYKIAFANYLEEVDFNKRPLSKLTKDIAEQLELIK